ncbi:MAG: hypothetical protein JKX69_15195 [Rhodobacteraceae bacterium]|nr:hypothetical protein [Paracoccaceae bacterium]
MRHCTEIDIEPLRRIGWSHWDPMGLCEMMGSWEGRPFADEYDQYLSVAAAMVKRGEPREEVVDYLSWVETEHMALNPLSARANKLEIFVDMMFDLAFGAEVAQLSSG